MADTKSRYFTNIDLHNKSVLNEVIERVESLPSDAVEGRRVYFDGEIWYYDGTRWRKAVDVVTEWTDEPSDARVPSERLVYDSINAVQDEVDGIDTRVCALEDDMERVEGDLEDLLDEVTDIRSHLDDVDADIADIRADLDRKTDKTMAIPIWDADETYFEHSTVIYEGVIYISQLDGNIGNDPSEDDGTWWKRAVADSNGSKVFVIGDGSSTTFELEHGFGTYNVVAVFRYTDGDREYFDAKYSAVSLSHIRVELNIAPPTDGVAVIVFDAGGTAYPTGEGMVHVQSEPSAVWSIDHGLNGLVAVQTYGSDGAEISGSITQTDGNVTVEFNSEVSGTAVIIAPPNDDVWHRNGSIWEIPHGKGRLVLVQCYDNFGRLIGGHITQDIETMNTVTIIFNEDVTGYAVVL